MSFRLQSMVWPFRGAEGTAKLVLARLADLADDNGGSIFPSVQRVAADCGIGERTVQEALRKLEACGVLVKVREATAKQPREYRIDVRVLSSAEGDGVRNPHPSNDAEGCEIRTGAKSAPVRISTERGAKSAPNPTIEPTSYSVEADASPGAEGADDAQAEKTDSQLVWGPGLDWLAKASGKSSNSLRSLIGRWCKGGREALVLTIMRECRGHSPPIADPIPWIETALANRSQPNDRKAHFPQQRGSARSYLVDDDAGLGGILDGLGGELACLRAAAG